MFDFLGNLDEIKAQIQEFLDNAAAMKKALEDIKAGQDELAEAVAAIDARLGAGS